MDEAHRLFWVREIASDDAIPIALREHAMAFLEHYARALDLGWTPERAWDRAMRETTYLGRKE